MMGVQFYSQAELLAIMPGGGGDASTILAVQLAATKLNIAAGADATQISATMLQADALLAQFGGKLPYNVAPSAPEGQAMVSLAGLLDLYNNGQMSPNCAQTATPTPIFTPTFDAGAIADTNAHPHCWPIAYADRDQFGDDHYHRGASSGHQCQHHHDLRHQHTKSMSMIRF